MCVLNKFIYSFFCDKGPDEPELDIWIAGLSAFASWLLIIWDGVTLVLGQVFTQGPGFEATKKYWHSKRGPSKTLPVGSSSERNWAPRWHIIWNWINSKKNNTEANATSRGVCECDACKPNREEKICTEEEIFIIQSAKNPMKYVRSSFISEVRMNVGSINLQSPSSRVKFTFDVSPISRFPS